MRASFPRNLLFWLLFCLVASATMSQEAVVSPESAGLQRGFGSVALGMSPAEVKSALGRDPNFRYRGDPDLSFLPASDVPVIEVQGAAFISTGTFQFHDDALYVITLVLNPGRLDYFSVYRSLVEKYGESDRLSPSSVTWENETTRITLEKPVTVKYLDRGIFEQIIESGRLEESLQTQTTARFLEQL